MASEIDLTPAPEWRQMASNVTNSDKTIRDQGGAQKMNEQGQSVGAPSGQAGPPMGS